MSGPTTGGSDFASDGYGSDRPRPPTVVSPRGRPSNPNSPGYPPAHYGNRPPPHHMRPEHAGRAPGPRYPPSSRPPPQHYHARGPPHVRPPPNVGQVPAGNISSPHSDGLDEEQWPLPAKPIVPPGDDFDPRSNAQRSMQQSRPRNDMPQRPPHYRQPPPPWHAEPQPRPSYHGTGDWTGSGYRPPPQRFPPPFAQRPAQRPYPPPNGGPGFGPNPNTNHLDPHYGALDPRGPLLPPSAVRRGPSPNSSGSKNVHSFAEEANGARSSVRSGRAALTPSRLSNASSNAIPGYYTEDHDETSSSQDFASPGEELPFSTPPTHPVSNTEHLTPRNPVSRFEFEPEQSEGSRDSTIDDRDARDTSPEPQSLIRQASLGTKSRPVLRTLSRKNGSVDLADGMSNERNVALNFGGLETLPGSPSVEVDAMVETDNAQGRELMNLWDSEVAASQGPTMNAMHEPEMSLQPQATRVLVQPRAQKGAAAMMIEEDGSDGEDDLENEQRDHVSLMPPSIPAKSQARTSMSIRPIAYESDGAVPVRVAAASMREDTDEPSDPSSMPVVPPAPAQMGGAAALASALHRERMQSYLAPSTRSSVNVDYFSGAPQAALPEPPSPEMVSKENRRSTRESRVTVDSPNSEPRRSRLRSLLFPGSMAVDTILEAGAEPHDSGKRKTLTVDNSDARSGEGGRKSWRSPKLQPPVSPNSTLSSLPSPRPPPTPDSPPDVPFTDDGSIAPEMRASLTSLPDLIRRATKLANNLDRGRTASRLGLNWFDGAGNDSSDSDASRKYGLQPSATWGTARRSALSFSEILTAFPDPNDPNSPSAGGLEAGRAVLPSDSKASKAPVARRKCCGMPRWAFWLLMVVLLLLIVAAVLIPIFLVYLPSQREKKGV